MYYVSDDYKTEVSKEENTPISLIKVRTGFYWENEEDMLYDTWTKVFNGHFNVVHTTEDYVSYNGAYKITFDGDKAGSVGDFAYIAKSIIFDSTVSGIRINFKGTHDREGQCYARLYVNSVLKVERDLAHCRDTWGNYLESFEPIGVGNKTVQFRIELKRKIDHQPIEVFVDDFEVWVEDQDLYFTDFSEDVPYWDVSDYIRGGGPPSESKEVVYTAFPIKVSDLRSSTDGRVEGVQITVPIGDRVVLGMIDDDKIMEYEVTIVNTFYEFRRGGPSENYDSFQKCEFVVDSVVVDEGKGSINFDLKPKYAVQKILVPIEPFDRDFCRHVFKSAECGYVQNADGTILGSCDKTKDGINGCQAHENTINFGAFPGIPVGRVYVG